MQHSLAELVTTIRERHRDLFVPNFDPVNGNESARFLFVLEAPGPGAVESCFVSLSNDDPTARNFSDQLDKACIREQDIAVWNVVPWYLGNGEMNRIRPARKEDVDQGREYLVKVISLMQNLQCIVLVGGAARQAHVYLSQRTKVRILSCHHPSQRVQNTLDGAFNENVEIFRYMRQSSEPIF